jgi:hypothetical protein
VGGASASIWGANRLFYGQCCSNQTLDGTRANVSVSSFAPDQYNCIGFHSVVTSDDSNRQLLVGIAKCGVNSGGADGTCGANGSIVKMVERIPAMGSPVCYQHGAGSLNAGDLFTVDNNANDGIWHTFINGTPYEAQSGYTHTLHISEWGEYTGSTCGFSATATFTNWRRYNYPNNVWTTVQSSNQQNTGCWTLGAVTNGSFTVGH